MPKRRKHYRERDRAAPAREEDFRDKTLLQLYFSLLAPSQSAEDLRSRGFRPREDTQHWPFVTPIDWSANPFGDDNWQYQFHAWRMIDPLLHEFDQTGDATPLQEALEIAVDWHRFHVREERSAKYSWFDMSAGIRAIKIAAFFEFIKRAAFVPSPGSRKALDQLARMHAQRLGTEHYIAMNNHGMWVVLGLRMLAHSALRGQRKSDSRRISTKYFKSILEFSYTPEGVHKEHSPSYAELVTRWVDRPAFRRWWPTVDAELRGKVAALTPWFTFPDGTIARLGDSLGPGRDGPLTGGEHATLGVDRNVLIRDLSRSGYVIVRSSPETAAEAQSMMVVTGACWSLTHKHVDDLSFELFEFGRRIFIDSGMFSYTRGPMRRYVLSADAHNTVSLSDRQVLPKMLDVDGASLRPVAVRDSKIVVEGSVSRRSLFSQRRVITYAPGRSLLVHDELAADSRRAYASSLHLAPDLQPVPVKGGFRVDLGGGRSLTAELVEPDATIRIVRGQADPPLGWSTVEYQKMEPASVVQALAEGTNRTLTWRIAFS